MKKKIVFISLLIFFILLIIPSIPALEFNVLLQTQKQNIINNIQNSDFIEFKEEIREKKIFKNKIINSDITNFFKEYQKKIRENPSQSKCIISMIILISLIRIFGKIGELILKIFEPVIDIFISILTIIARIIIAIITPIVKLIILGLIAYFSIAAIIDVFFLFVFLLLIFLQGGY